MFKCIENLAYPANLVNSATIVIMIYEEYGNMWKIWPILLYLKNEQSLTENGELRKGYF